MSYQVLARKWRPKTFREMVGQEHVLKALINALDHNRLHHAYLFSGTRGVGKTTIARILAKCLNCESGVSSEPCGQCSACESIKDGRFVDLIEVDAASRTKVEDTRELLENVQYAPTAGRYKVYLIDEVHMLSTHSFNALLKTLEEPPPHVKFLLATTDPQKLPATILSRCLQFHLKNMSPEYVVSHLKHVLEQEMVAFDEAALWLLGRAADGSMRDALSLTDQAIGFGSGKVSEPEVRNMLGTIDQTALYDIIEALGELNGVKLLQAVEQLSEHAPDFPAALEELLSLLHRLAIAQVVPEAADNSQGDQEQIKALAAKLTGEDVQLFYQLALNGRRDLPLASDPRSGFEMVLLRMLAFRPSGVEQLPTAAVNNAAAAQAINPATPQEAAAPAKKPESAAAPAAIREELSALFEEPQASKKPLADVKPSEEGSSAGEEPLADREPLANEKPLASEEPLANKKPSSNQQPAADPQSPALEQPPADKTHSAVDLQSAPAGADNPVKSAVEPSNPAAQASTASSSEQKLEVVATEQQPVTEKVVSAPTQQPPSLSQLSPQSWPALFNQLDFGGIVGSIASHCSLQSVQDKKFAFSLDPANAALFNDSYTQRIQEHLSLVFETELKISIEVAEVKSETPATRKQRIQQELHQQAVADIQADPNVKLLIDAFDATLDVASIKVR